MRLGWLLVSRFSWKILILWKIAYCSSDTAAAGGCDLTGWVHDKAAAGEEGYHVLCAPSPGKLFIYKSGVASDTPIVLEYEGKGLRKNLTSALAIGSIIDYSDAKKKLRWRKQPWALYTAAGQELEFAKEYAEIEEWHRVNAAPMIMLLFEGGIWRWPTIKVGYERLVLPNVMLRTVARQPALFELILNHSTAEADLKGQQDVLSKALLEDVITKAKPRMSKSSLEGAVNEQQRSSEGTFLSYHSDAKLKALHRLTASLLRAPLENLNEFQVLRYNKGQHYDAHRDYWDPREFPDVPRFKNSEGFWTMRHATLLWYLEAPQSGGETWFPRAHGGPIPYGAWTACDDRGEKVSPAKATAVLFYSLQANGDIDEFSWHCGCPVKEGTKWAANSWLSNTPAQPRQHILKLQAAAKKRKAAEAEL
eukprot:TRINITY_DN7048_c0_g4_i1.p1 TRINITY_DN7048_c0_g4~~TRINITY_DN7048_c0_g4_i1.p1  ORF type:complete len:421 (+),score=52.03 TRINITY_DN7048_c0_g4_i1:46-1308(+)